MSNRSQSGLSYQQFEDIVVRELDVGAEEIEKLRAGVKAVIATTRARIAKIDLFQKNQRFFLQPGFTNLQEGQPSKHITAVTNQGSSKIYIQVRRDTIQLKYTPVGIELLQKKVPRTRMTEGEHYYYANELRVTSPAVLEKPVY